MKTTPLVTHMLTRQKFYPDELVPYLGHLWIVKDAEPINAKTHAHRYTLSHIADRTKLLKCMEMELVHDICKID